MSTISLNNHIIVTPWVQGQGLKSEVKGGFAWVEQKIHLGVVTCLSDARLNDGTIIPKGSEIYADVTLLEAPTSVWAKSPKKCSAFGEQEFIIMPASAVIVVDTSKIE